MCGRDHRDALYRLIGLLAELDFANYFNLKKLIAKSFYEPQNQKKVVSQEIYSEKGRGIFMEETMKVKTLDSRDVAKMVSEEHKKLLRDIE